MKKYLISDLAEEINTSKTQIRRSIKNNNIVAINETNREHKYVAKEYSEESRLLVYEALNKTPEENKSEQKETPEENKSEQNVTEENKSEQNVTPEENKSEQNIIEENKSEQMDNISKFQNEIVIILKEDKERLIKELKELKEDKRNQEEMFFQERQSFHNMLREEKKIIEYLQIELKGNTEQEKTKKIKWYNFYKK